MLYTLDCTRLYITIRGGPARKSGWKGSTVNIVLCSLEKMLFIVQSVYSLCIRGTLLENLLRTLYKENFTFCTFFTEQHCGQSTVMDYSHSANHFAQCRTMQNNRRATPWYWTAHFHFPYLQNFHVYSIPCTIARVAHFYISHVYRIFHACLFLPCTKKRTIRHFHQNKTQNVQIYVVHEEKIFWVLLKKNWKVVSNHFYKWVLSKVGSHATMASRVNNE